MYSNKALHAVQWDGSNIKDIDVFMEQCGYHYLPSGPGTSPKDLVLQSNNNKYILTVHLNEVLYFKGNNPKLHAMPAKKFNDIHLKEN